MSNAILILGQSGSGKSTSIRNLPASETFVLNIIDKPLPFKGSSKSYTLVSSTNPMGNYFSSDDHTKIKQMINYVNDKRPDIKYMIIDDFGISIMNQFMRKALIKGYDKYSELAQQAFEVIDLVVRGLRPDLFIFVMMHVETDKQGVSKPKTVGNMIDQYVCIEGKFTYVLHTAVNDGKYYFITNYDGVHCAKTPMGLFDMQLIDNDLLVVVNKINEYNNQDVPQ